MRRIKVEKNKIIELLKQFYEEKIITDGTNMVKVFRNYCHTKQAWKEKLVKVFMEESIENINSIEKVNNYLNISIQEEIGELKSIFVNRYSDEMRKRMPEFYRTNMKPGVIPPLLVCPICNMNTMPIYSKEKSMSWRMQFDHFYPKSKDEYAFLILNFWNLVPTCSTCNHIAGDKPKEYNPLISNEKEFVWTWKQDSIIEYIKNPKKNSPESDIEKNEKNHAHYKSTAKAYELEIRVNTMIEAAKYRCTEMLNSVGENDGIWNNINGRTSEDKNDKISESINGEKSEVSTEGKSYKPSDYGDYLYTEDEYNLIPFSHISNDLIKAICEGD